MVPRTNILYKVDFLRMQDFKLGVIQGHSKALFVLIRIKGKASVYISQTLKKISVKSSIHVSIYKSQSNA